MYTSSPRITHVRPELEYMAEYLPGESPKAYSLHRCTPIAEADALALSA